MRWKLVALGDPATNITAIGGLNTKIFVAMKSIDEVLEKISNKKLLVVFPHPDDESVMAGGLIQRAMKLGFEVTVLILTEGDRGKIFVNGRGRSTVEIRRQEMAEAMSRLGVIDWIMWKFPDGKLRYRHKWRERLGKFIEETKPGVIVSYDLSGVSGHPDHIVVAREIRQLLKKKPEVSLYWVSFEGEMRKRVVNMRVDKYLSQPEYVLDLSFSEAWRKWRSVFTHKSQNLKGFLGSPWCVLAIKARKEWYTEPGNRKRYRYGFIKFKV